ncbi:MAG: tetratricopeptide repeat protein [bacterium]|nr:tetratricopeptide repeat protein [bacterium]
MRSWIVVFIIGIGLASIVKAESPEDILYNAKQLRYEGILIESASLYEKYLLQNPNDVEVRFEFIELLEMLKQKEKVIAQVRILRKQVPNDPRLEKYSELLISTKKEAIESKVKEFENYVSSPNPNPKTVLDYARYCASSGLVVRAFELYQQYLRLRPNDDRIKLEFAQHLGWNNRFSESEEWLNEILKNNPNNVEARMFLADIKYWQGFDDDALRQYETVLKIAPKNNRALDAITRIKKSSGYQERKLIAEAKNNPEGQALISLAKFYYSVDRFYEADSLLKLRLQRIPDDREAKKLYNEMQENRKVFFQRKIKDLENALIQNPNDASTILQLARLHSANANFSRAIELYDKYLSITGDDFNIQLERANVLNWNGDYANAIQEYLDVLSHQPDNRSAKVGLAFAQLYLNQNLEEVESLFQDELKQNPKDLEVKLGYAEVLYKQGKFDQARKMFKEIVEVDTANVTAKKALLAMDTDLSPMIYQAENVVRSNPSDLQAKKRLLGLYLDVHRFFEAEILLNELLKNSPNDPYLKSMQNEINQYKKSYALDELKNIKLQIQLYPNDTSYRIKYAQLLTLAGNFKEASEQYRLLIEREPNNPQHYLQLGEIYIAQKKLNEAQWVYQGLIERFPTNTDYRAKYAQLLAWDGKNDAALVEYEQTLAMNPNSVTALVGLANTYKWRGDSYNAYEYYQKALAIDPQNTEAINGLKSLRNVFIQGLQTYARGLHDNNGYRYNEYGSEFIAHISINTQVSIGSGSINFSQDGFRELGWSINSKLKYNFSRFTSASVESKFFQFKNRYTNSLAVNLMHDFSGINELKGLTIHLLYNYGDAVFELGSLQNLQTWTEKLITEKISSHIVYQMDTSTTLEGKVDYISISDRNSRTDLWSEIGYKISPILTIGGRYDWVSSPDTGKIGGYWAPKNYASITGWIKLANQLDRFNYEVKLNLGQVMNTKNTISTTQAKLGYKMVEWLTTDFSYFHLRTIRLDGKYNYEGLLGSLTFHW